MSGRRCLHAVYEEGVLLAYDLGRDFQDRPCALVKAARQPIGVLQAFGKKIPVGLALGLAGDAGEVDLIHQDARKRVGIELDRPAAAVRSFHQHVGHNRFGDAARKRHAGSRIERADLSEHFDQVFLVDAAGPFQRLEITPRQKVEIVDKGAHGRVEPITGGELQRQASGKIAGKNTGRIEVLTCAEYGINGCFRRPEPLGDLGGVAAHVTCLVKGVGKLSGNQA